MSFNIQIESGSSVRLPTAGKYCDRDIIVSCEPEFETWTINYVDGTSEEIRVVLT